ncbi:hypothetical protein SHKM778_46160 [Streptomyces sp. KM77-8]|uniref:Tyr recombinase domain-containing protein n=1 Tax=Streptomyces haneummycinicus TaxID=3074435 RepID=A0AAT9HLT9_9ACTN
MEPGSPGPAPASRGRPSPAPQGLLSRGSRDWARRRAPRKAPPIRTAALSAMVATRTAADEHEQPKALRDAALLTLGWGMLSRRSELANLLIEHLAVEDDGVTVRVAFSKTDQAAHGEDTFVPADPEVPSLCPVVQVRSWLGELRRHGITSGPLFRHITRGGTVRPRSGPRGDFLSPDAIGNIVKARARLAGVSAPGGRAVTAHGLRRGPAQEISEAGGDPTAQGRWKPGSPTVRRHYIEPARGRTDNPLHAARAKARARADTGTAERDGFRCPSLSGTGASCVADPAGPPADLLRPPVRGAGSRSTPPSGSAMRPAQSLSGGQLNTPSMRC